ncbi:MAG: rod shape-determining protein MreC [Pseudomonadota bacterium]
MRGLSLSILLAIGLGLVLLQTAPSIKQRFNPVRTATNDQIASGGGIGWLGRITGEATRDRRIVELEADVRELSRWRAAAISMAERLEAYETILNLQGEPPARGVTARIVAESDGPFSETLLANAGQAQGVEPGFVAVNEGGVVGRVIELGERSARILVVTDFNSRVPVLGEVSGARAIMYGGRDGYGVLTDLPEAGGFDPNERILTSGEGGVFPRGLVAGRAVLRGGNNWRVAFAMKEARAGFVRLIPPASIPKPEDDQSVSADTEQKIVADTGLAPRLTGQ